MQVDCPGLVLDGLASGAIITLPTVILVAHPDDETLAMAGMLRRFPKLTILQLTDGAPLDGVDARRLGFASRAAYAAAREHEAKQALAQLSIDCRRVCYGVPDQDSIFSALALARAVERELRTARLVFTHAYEGGHPDHDTAALLVQTACSKIARAGAVPPRRLEFASYHCRNGRMAAGRFWPAMGHPDIAIPLRADVEAAKRRALEAYRTQAHVLKYFRTNIERYRIAPDYDFTRPSPPGLALYDRLAWRMTSERWRDCAAAVSTSLEMLAS